MKSAAPSEVSKPRARKTKAAPKTVEVPQAVEAPQPPAPAVSSKKAPAKQAPAKTADAAGTIDAEARDRMVAEAAYYLAEQRGFEPGYETEDWLLAEAEVDRRLAGKKAPRA